MSSFSIDASGFVAMGSEHGSRFAGINMVWSDLSPFTQGYIEALFAALHTTPVVQERERGGWVVGFSDLAPETLARIIADCVQWTKGWADPNGSKQDGEYFWRYRQGDHGSVFPPLTVQLGDDGKVRFATQEARS